jgi:hypothetical protein
VVQEYLEKQYLNPAMLPSKSHFHLPMKWDGDKLFKHKNKQAIIIKQAELAAAADPLDSTLSKDKKTKMEFGKYYQEAVKRVKDDIGAEGVDEYVDEARRLNNGEVPPETQAK